MFGINVAAVDRGEAALHLQGVHELRRDPRPRCVRGVRDDLALELVTMLGRDLVVDARLPGRLHEAEVTGLLGRVPRFTLNVGALVRWEPLRQLHLQCAGERIVVPRLASLLDRLIDHADMFGRITEREGCRMP